MFVCQETWRGTGEGNERRMAREDQGSFYTIPLLECIRDPYVDSPFVLRQYSIVDE